MSELTNCKNFGAPIERYPCKCEYCGTEYGIIDEWDDMRLFADGEEFVRATSAGIMTVNEARSLLGFDKSHEADRGIASIGLRTEFINQILSKY